MAQLGEINQLVLKRLKKVERMREAVDQQYATWPRE